MQNPSEKKSALTATKVFERKVFLKEIKELQLLKLVYHIRRNNFRVYWSYAYYKGHSAMNRKWCIKLIFFLITCFGLIRKDISTHYKHLGAGRLA